METKTANSKLDELFVRWKQAFMDYGEEKVKDNNGITLSLFIEDGIMDKKGIPDEELDRIWKGSRRIVFFLKEQNQHVAPSERWPEKIRGWFTPWKKGSTNFYRRIGLLLYGFTSVSKDKSIKRAEIEKCKKEKIAEAYRDIPFAFVEAKKEPGGSHSCDSEIMRHLIRYSDFVKEEINILNPGILLCCGTPQHNFMLNVFFPADYKWTYATDNFHYDGVSGMIIIKINHPSYRRIKDFEYYEMAMESVRKFLESFPDALNFH